MVNTQKGLFGLLLNQLLVTNTILQVHGWDPLENVFIRSKRITPLVNGQKRSHKNHKYKEYNNTQQIQREGNKVQ